MKQKKWLFMGVVLILLAVILVMSVYTSRFDISFADHVVLKASTSARDPSNELEEGQVQELKDILNGKKLWTSSESARSGVYLIFSGDARDLTLYLTGQDGIVSLADGQSIRLTIDECVRISEILALYNVKDPFEI